MKEVPIEEEVSESSEACSGEAVKDSDEGAVSKAGGESVISGRLLTMAGLFDIWRSEDSVSYF